MSITDIVANIDRRLADLDAELSRLTGARAALIDDGAAAPRSQFGPRRLVARRPSRRMRSCRPERLVALLSRSDGLTTKQLSCATNVDPGEVLAMLKEQERAGEIRRSGMRAATRWHVITDEDRIAELETASHRGRARRS